MFLNFPDIWWKGHGSASLKSFFNDQTNNLPNHSFSTDVAPPEAIPTKLQPCVLKPRNPYHQPPPINWAYDSQLQPPLGASETSSKVSLGQNPWGFGNVEAEVDAAGGKKNKYPP